MSNLHFQDVVLNFEGCLKLLGSKIRHLKNFRIIWNNLNLWFQPVLHAAQCTLNQLDHEPAKPSLLGKMHTKQKLMFEKISVVKSQPVQTLMDRGNGSIMVWASFAFSVTRCTTEM